MQTTDLCQYPREIIQDIFKLVPLINQVLQSEPEQERFFIKSSRIFKVKPQELVINRGEYDSWVYFLLIGQLLVYPEFADKKNHLVSYIAPGEMFGELAYIRELNRNATIVADENCKKVIYLGTDFSAFANINDFSAVSVFTKISFYTFAIRSIRKRVASLKIDYPENELCYKIPGYKSFSGEKNSMHELLYLRDQSIVFSKHLCEWNRSLEIDANFKAGRGQISRLSSLDGNNHSRQARIKLLDI